MENKNSIAYSEDKEAYVRGLLTDKVTIYPTTAARMMCEHFDIEYNEEIGRTYRRKFQQDLEIVNTVSYKAAKKRRLKKSKYYLISSAQNSTPVFGNLLKNMEALATHLNGEIGIIASRYRNPTLYDEGLKENYWDESIEDYLIASRMELFKGFVVGADVRIPFTTNLPINNARRIVKDYTMVVGHPKQDFESLPNLDKQLKRFIYTTGSITLPYNYSDTMAGKVGSTNHKNGFLLVEVLDRAEGKYSIVNVEADTDGNFMTPDFKVEFGTVVKDENLVDAVVLGDLHVGFTNDEAVKKSYRKVQKYSPKYVVLHDVLSAETVHRYNINDPFKAFKFLEQGLTIEKELEQSIKEINKIREMCGVVVIPSANHHFILENWVKNFSWKSSLVNAKTYFKISSMLLNNEVDEKGIFARIIDVEEMSNVETLSYNESYRVNGVELSQHGDKGVNGSRANLRQYERTGIPHIVAHSHSPAKLGDVLCVGTLSKERMGYNVGYSTWRDNIIGLVLKNGKIVFQKI